MLTQITHQTFEPYINETFTIVRPDEQTVPLQLVSVTRLADSVTQNLPTERTPFSILFRGAPGLNLPQQIHTFEHAALGRLDLFAVPLQPDQQGTYFEVIFT